MCKHKSGGMKNPSGSTSQSGLSDRTAASYSSHNCPQDSSGASHSQVSNMAIASTDHTYDTQMRSYTAVPALQPADSSGCSSSCNAHTFLPNDESLSIPHQKYENITYIPNVQESEEQDYFESPESEEEESEQSPMLMKEACGMYCTPMESWNPNILSESEFDKDILKPKLFGACDVYTCTNVNQHGEANNCDNYPMYHQIQNTFQETINYMPPPYNRGLSCSTYFSNNMGEIDESDNSGVDVYNYATKSKKKWFLNQKCKSADSEPDPRESCITTVPTQGLVPSNYNYGHDQSTNLDSFNSRCNSYLKPTYLNNGDPVAGPSGLQRPSSINWEMGLNNRDSEFRSRSYSLTPTVNFAVFESESSSEADDVPEVTVTESADVPLTNEQHNAKTVDDIFDLPMMSLGKVIPISPSAAQLSIASSYGDNGSPICKICHMTARENDPLISPCRCSGTMQYIHCGCLMRWLEVCHKRGRRPASCELCQYQYHWHKKFKIRHWQLPQCSRKDKVLHFLFFLSVMLMISCASITVLCFKQDKGTKVDPDRTELTQSEIVTLVCGVLFFLAFFVAMYVEVKSHDTLYQLLVKFIHINQQWYIDEYEKKETAPVAV